MPPPDPLGTTRVLPMELQVGNRLTDETGEYVIAGRPYTTNAGKDVHVRVRRVDNAEVTMIRTWAAHERISVKPAKGEQAMMARWAKAKGLENRARGFRDIARSGRRRRPFFGRF